MIDMKYAGSPLGLVCFECADQIMRDLAPENVRGGSSIEDTAAAYMRWRASIGRPCTMEFALCVANGGL